MLGICLAAFLLLGACSRPSSLQVPQTPTKPQPSKQPVAAPTSDKPKAILKACLYENPGSLDFQSSASAALNFLTRNLFNTLVRYSTTGYGLEPELCSKMPTVSSDGKTYAFELRSNIRFHDGATRLLSDDIKFTIERMLDPKASRPNRWVFMAILGAERFSKGKSTSVVGFRKIDDLKFQITLQEPDALFLNGLAAPCASILSRTLCGNAPDKWVLPSGSGPFRILSNKPGEVVELGSFSGHYDVKIPALDGIEYRVLPFAQAIVEFEKGNLDVLAVPPEEVERVMRAFAGSMLECQSPKTCYLLMNIRNPAWKDLRVRQALALSLDRDRVVQALFGGRATTASGFVPPGVPGGFVAGTGPAPKMDLSAARKLVQTLGSFSLEAWLEEGVNPGLGSLLETMAKDAGISLKVLKAPAPDYAKARKDGSIPAGIGIWEPRVPDAGEYLYPFFSYTNAMSSGYYNVAVQDSLESGKTLALAKSREQLYQRAEKTILSEDVAVIPLFHPKEYLAVRPGVKGVVLHPIYGMIVNFTTKETPKQ